MASIEKLPRFHIGKIVTKKNCVQGVGRFDSLKGVKKGWARLHVDDETKIEVRFLSVGETVGTGIFESTDARAASFVKGISYPYSQELS